MLQLSRTPDPGDVRQTLGLGHMAFPWPRDSQHYRTMVLFYCRAYFIYIRPVVVCSPQMIQSRSRVQYQALLTQLIFEHTLRMRVKSDINSPGTSNANGSNNMSPTSSSSSSTGKLLNLMTSDMDNLERGKDFLEICESTPVQCFYKRCRLLL